MTSLLAKRYATALFEAASKQSAVDPVGNDLQKLGVGFESPGLKALVTSPETTAARRKDVLAKLLDGAHQLTHNAIGVVLQRRREDILPELPAAFEELRLVASGMVTGVIETAQSMSADDLAKVEEQARVLVGGDRKVSLTVKENPDLIGGVRIRIGNTLYDGSVATALEELAQKLSAAPLP